MGVARSREPETNRPTSQLMKTMCFAKHGWKLVVVLSPTPGRGRSHFGVVLLTDTTHNAATIRKGHSNQLIHWDLIKAEIGKFSGYMAEMTRSNPSGLSDSDKSVVAAANFAAIEKHNFTLMHCWNILKDESKWMELKRSMDKTKKMLLGMPPLMTPPTQWTSIQMRLHRLTLLGSVPWGGTQQKQLRRKLRQHHLSTHPRCMNSPFKRSHCSRRPRLRERFALMKL
ncbi:hypothetical protein BS78_05G080100 [Paspalum vaginatum]|nr:hypothetical protein BS78_05G080100 [Paspalum vaginatum]